jgi:hypothetical protein
MLEGGDHSNSGSGCEQDHLCELGARTDHWRGLCRPVLAVHGFGSERFDDDLARK